MITFLSIGFALFFACSSGPAIADAEPEQTDEAELAEGTAEEGIDGVVDEEEAWDEMVFPPMDNLPVSSFGEIWAYLTAGRESSFRPAYPISDIGYFGAEVDAYGRLVGVPNRRNLRNFRGRVHLVVACNSRGLTHFVIEEGSAARRVLVADLLEAAKAFDGLNVDFESIPGKDRDAFLSFLKELRAGLGNKMFTIAVQARTKTISDDIFNYEKITPLVDRVFVMAYDEHWSGSKPGPIASMNWGRSVAAYALRVVGPEKLIMGLPFYGRTWGDYSTNRALIYSTMEGVRKAQKVTEVQRENGIPHFNYEMTVNITAYYEDVYSLAARLDMYRGLGVKSVGFWALGQEDPAVWGQLTLTGNN